MGKGAFLTIMNHTDLTLQFGTSDRSRCWKDDTIDRVRGKIPPRGQSDRFYIEADAGITCLTSPSTVKFKVEEAGKADVHFANVHIEESNSVYRQIGQYVNRLMATALIEHGQQDTISIDVVPYPFNWMRELPGERLLTELSIPGTHDSGTYRLGAGLAKCQSLSIEDQLQAGIRFLDIRCRYVPGEGVLTIHHGATYCMLNFDDVLRQITGFLQKNNQETVLMMVKQEDSKESGQVFANKVESYLANYAQWVYTTPTDSKRPLTLRLRDVRGKIVLLKRYGEGRYGYEIGLGDDTASCGAAVAYQDIYGAADSVASKKLPLKLLLEFAREHPHDSLLYLNYVSMSGIATSPATLATELNAYVEACIRDRTTQRLGVLPMDFPASTLIQRILNGNL